MILVFLLLTSACYAQVSDIAWQITKESPAYGLTLGYTLPGEQLQKIVGDKFKPQLNADGNGYLMLFLATSKKYKLDSTTYEEMQIAHILIGVEGSLNSPLVITGENQAINSVFLRYGFNTTVGKIELNLTHTGDSIRLIVALSTQEGSIHLDASFLNNPSDWKTIAASKISASNPSSFFGGSETFQSIQIDSIAIKSEGKNWITELDLPAKPDKIRLNTSFSWDFVFSRD